NLGIQVGAYVADAAYSEVHSCVCLHRSLVRLIRLRALWVGFRRVSDGVRVVAGREAADVDVVVGGGLRGVGREVGVEVLRASDGYWHVRVSSTDGRARPGVGSQASVAMRQESGTVPRNPIHEIPVNQRNDDEKRARSAPRRARI